MLGGLPFRCVLNPRQGVPGIVVLPQAGFRRAKAAITRWPDYAPTPLRDLPELARRAGIAALRLKDEATRLGLGSFKPLGAGFAVEETVRREGAGRTLACATEGNHGRAVAWAARRFGCRAVVFLPTAASPARAAAIAGEGAELRRVPGSYDDAVRACAAEAGRAGWTLIADTSWPGYLEIPRAIMQGYRMLADEALDQWEGPPPTHVFVQAGVGGLAAAVSAHLRARLPEPPALVVVEPEHAACLLASAELGTPTELPGPHATLMAGLACGVPSLLAWQELERAAWAFMAIPDTAVPPTMRLLAEAGVTSGESGAAGLAGLLLATADPATRAALSLGPESRVLAVSTEGATDMQHHVRVVKAVAGSPP